MAMEKRFLGIEDKRNNKIKPEVIFEYEESEDSEERLSSIFEFLLGGAGRKEKENIADKIA